MLDAVDAWHYFTSPVYNIKKPEFLKMVDGVCDEYINLEKKKGKLNEMYPLYNTDSLKNDTRLKDFSNYIIETSLMILDQQGYNVSIFEGDIHDLWCQEHYKHSGHERHIHNSIISGFYFLRCPTDGCRVLIHDPRSVKEFFFLPEKDTTQATYASHIINFDPEPGTFIFTNSWLPHSFTKNSANKPSRFVHFNVGVIAKKQDVTVI